MTKKDPTFPDALATTLLANLSAFQSFARGRLGDETLAADAVQEGLLRALRAADSLEHDENLVAWFYRILRNVLTDLHRRRTVQKAALARFTREQEAMTTEDPEMRAQACACVTGLLPALRPEYSRVIQLADVDGRTHEEVAHEIGISRANVKVRLHRARKQLRQRLKQTCQMCATHGCLDCSCEPELTR